MPESDSRSRFAWVTLEAVIAAMLALVVGLLLDVRGSVLNLGERVTMLERRMDKSEADNYTPEDALQIWRAISDVAKEAAQVSPAVQRELDAIRHRVDLLERKTAGG